MSIMTERIILNQTTEITKPEVSVLEAPDGGVEDVTKRAASAKHYKIGKGYVATCFSKDAPVHYKDNYTNAKEQWKDVDQSYSEDKGAYIVFPRMPIEVRVYKDKIGYEIRDKKTGDIKRVELLETDNAPVVGTSVPKMSVLYDVNQFGVRLWKITDVDGPKKWKWEITDIGDKSNLKFRENTEAFVTGDESNKVEVVTKKELLPENKFHWTEVVGQGGVTIDTDFTGSTSDGYILGTSPTYATARSTANSTHNTNHQNVGQKYLSFQYTVYRTYVDFDTSALDDGATIGQVNLKLTCYDYDSTTNFTVYIKKHTWVEGLGGGNLESNYDGCLAATNETNFWRNTSGMSEDVPYTSGNLDISRVNKTGDTKYSLISLEDINDSAPSGEERITFYSANYGTAAYRPILIVAYTTGWSGKILGVTDPAKIMGVEKANIAKVLGVE